MEAMVITGMSREYEIGTIVMISFHPLTYKLDYPIPVKILRNSTQKEFMEYWEKEDPKNLELGIKLYGPPDCEFYYEIFAD
jgi:hypothetical protein